MKQENSSLVKLLNELSINISDPDLLKNAFVHRSYLNENRKFHLPSNERLEFLGDACLELVVSEFLYKEYPLEPEGILTSYRGALVNTESLAESAKQLDLGKYLLLSRGEEEGGGRGSHYLLANTLEALIGAIYLNQGYDAAAILIHTYITNKLTHIISEERFRDPKSKLQEKTQAYFGITPQYEVTSEMGPDHNKVFTVAVKLNSNIVGSGKGSSKQKAELDAAKTAINNWETIETSMGIKSTEGSI